MRPDEELLGDIIEAAAAIEMAIAGFDLDDFVRVRLVRSSVMFEFIVIGEASAKLSDDLRNRYSDLPWSDIIGFRNVIVHGYFGLDWARAWRTATTDLPGFLERVRKIRAIEFP